MFSTYSQTLNGHDQMVTLGERLEQVIHPRGPFLWCVRCARTGNTSTCFILLLSSSCGVVVWVVLLRVWCVCVWFVVCVVWHETWRRFESTHGGVLGSTCGGFQRATQHTNNNTTNTNQQHHQHYNTTTTTPRTPHYDHTT